MSIYYDANGMEREPFGGSDRNPEDERVTVRNVGREFLTRLNQSDTGLKAGRCKNCGVEGYLLAGEWFHNDGFFSCTAADGSLTFRPFTPA